MNVKNKIYMINIYEMTCISLITFAVAMLYYDEYYFSMIILLIAFLDIILTHIYIHTGAKQWKNITT